MNNLEKVRGLEDNLISYKNQLEIAQDNNLPIASKIRDKVGDLIIKVMNLKKEAEELLDHHTPYRPITDSYKSYEIRKECVIVINICDKILEDKK